MTIDPRLIEEMRRLLTGRVLTMVPLRDLTSFRIGGPALAVVEPCNVEDMVNILSFLAREGLPSIVLGAGTNVLCSDEGYRGVVVKTGSLRRVAVAVNGVGLVRIEAGAGLGLTSLVNLAFRHGSHGMEPLWGIPGTVGGSVAVNAGAGGIGACDFVEELRLVNVDGTMFFLKRNDLEFGYRRASLPPGGVVVEALFRFPQGDVSESREALRYWMRMRKEKQPWRMPSAGCIFKNPTTGDSAGAIIDRLGFKGISQGGAQVSPVHANFIVNKGGATAEDVLALIRKIKRRVNEEYHIQLELEIQLIGMGFERVDHC